MACWLKKNCTLSEFVVAFTEIKGFGDLTMSINQQTNTLAQTLSYIRYDLRLMVAYVEGPVMVAKIIAGRKALKQYKPSGNGGMNIKFK